MHDESPSGDHRWKESDNMKDTKSEIFSQWYRNVGCSCDQYRYWSKAEMWCSLHPVKNNNSYMTSKLMTSTDAYQLTKQIYRDIK